MRGCLFVVALGVVVAAIVVAVGLPAFAAGVLTAGVTAAGLNAPDTTVTVSSDPPTDLVMFHADRVRVRATHATFRGLEIASLDITLGDVAILDRTARTVDGRLTGVVLPNVGARRVALGTISLSGGDDDVRAAATLAAGEAEALLSDAVENALGTRPASVALDAPDRITVDLGAAVHARLSVSAAGDLLATVTDGPAAGRAITLLRGGEDLPVRLASVTVSATGDVRLEGTVTAAILG